MGFYWRPPDRSCNRRCARIAGAIMKPVDLFSVDRKGNFDIQYKKLANKYKLQVVKVRDPRDHATYDRVMAWEGDMLTDVVTGTKFNVLTSVCASSEHLFIEGVALAAQPCSVLRQIAANARTNK